MRPQRFGPNITEARAKRRSHGANRAEPDHAQAAGWISDDHFDFEFATGASKALVQELGSLAFVERAESVVLPVPFGVGKTHLATYVCKPTTLFSGIGRRLTGTW